MKKGIPNVPTSEFGCGCRLPFCDRPAEVIVRGYSGPIALCKECHGSIRNMGEPTKKHHIKERVEDFMVAPTKQKAATIKGKLTRYLNAHKEREESRPGRPRGK